VPSLARARSFRSGRSFASGSPAGNIRTKRAWARALFVSLPPTRASVRVARAGCASGATGGCRASAWSGWRAR
jgi:hypothetical protein